jgi:hypothetical protein
MEETMRTPALIFAVAALIAGPAHAAEGTPSITVANLNHAKQPLHLSDAQRRQVVDAINGRNTLDKLPEGFVAQVGAKVPTQKKLPLEPLPRPLVYKIPELKQYYYAQLADNVLIVDPMKRSVVDVIAR